ncbi:MAG: DUF3267 domain-containing protein [Bacteroidota bacterium]
MTNITSGRSSRIPDAKKLQEDPGYRQIMELDFNEMIPFVLSNIKRRSVISFLYAGVTLGTLLFVLLYMILGLIESQLTWLGIIKQSLIGIFAGSFLVIPLHELLHGLAFRIIGARKIKFGADLQQFIFFVTADRYPVSGKELYFLAMTPFLVINTATVAIIAIWFPQVILFPAFLLFSHNIMCVGDFALVNFVHQQRNKVYTFDETDHRKSYFYEEVVATPE